MSARLEGKVALVTGAGSSGPGVGTGKAISVAFAREGASVVLVDIVAERAEDTLRRIEEEGAKAIVVQADITEPADSERMVRAAHDHFGGLDILVNNAAIAPHATIEDTSVETYEGVMAVNVKGAFLACKFAVPSLVERGGGSIVNIGSIASLRDTGAPETAYSASKAALLGLTVDLAGAYGRSNVRVNAVLPGIITTPMQQAVEAKRTGGGEDKKTVNANLLGRRGDAWDIANAVVFLCSDEAAYITGVVLPVDGGAVAGMPSSALHRAGL